MVTDFLNGTVFLRVDISPAGVSTRRVVGSDEFVQWVFDDLSPSDSRPRVISHGFFYHWLTDPTGAVGGVEAMVVDDLAADDLALLRASGQVTIDDSLVVKFTSSQPLECEADAQFLCALVREGDAMVLLLGDDKSTVVDGKVVTWRG